MNYASIGRFLGLAFAAFGAIFLLCLASGLAWDGAHFSIVWRWLFCGGVAVLLSLSLLCLGRFPREKIFHREAFAITAFVWIFAIVLGTLPYLLFVPGMDLADAIFESTSGLTSTGSTVLFRLDDLPRSLLFFRAMTQWIGGLGIVLFFVVFLPSLDGVSKVLFSHESTQSREDIGLVQLRRFGLSLLLLYFFLTVLCAGCYLWAGMGGFDAICYGMTTISTGGFSTRTDSLRAFPRPAIQWTAILFMALGSVNFVLLLNGIRRHWAFVWKNSELRAYLLLIGFFTLSLLIFFLEKGGPEPTHLRPALFHSVSFLSSTGFVANDYGQWAPSCQWMLLLAMVIGGCSGSTAGGLKVVRILTSLRLVRNGLERCFRQRIVRSVHLDGHAISDSHATSLANYVFLFAVVSLCLFPVYILFEPGLSFSGSLTTFLAALTNTGAGFGEFGPGRSFHTLHGHSKIFLSFLMLLGRLEMNAILVLFLSSFWKKFN